MWLFFGKLQKTALVSARGVVLVNYKGRGREADRREENVPRRGERGEGRLLFLQCIFWV